MKIQAAATPATGKLSLVANGVFLGDRIEAAAGEKPNRRTFRIVAYTGVPFRQWWSAIPVIIDFKGLKAKSSMPILLNHRQDEDSAVGQSDSATVQNGELVVTGTFHDPAGAPASAKVQQRADAGIQWQASVGGDPAKLERIEAGTTVKVNGREYTGPLLVARQTQIEEVSFVLLGADGNTSAIAAQGGIAMTFEKWLEAMGLDITTINAQQQTLLRAKFDAEVIAASNPVNPPPVPTPTPTPTPAVTSEQLTAQSVAQMRQQIADEMTRTNRVREICASHGNPTISITEAGAARQVNLDAHAIAAGWTTERVELEALRAARPTGAPFGYAVSAPAMNGNVIAAALAQSGGLSNPQRHFADQDLQAARQHFPRGIGLQQLLMAAARQHGYRGDSMRGDGAIRAVLQHAFRRIEAGFSTFSLPGILSNNANKFLLEGYMYVEQIWRRIAAIRPVNDFKTVTSYRMSGAFQFEKVGPTGELKHGAVSEDSFTNKADTYGKMFSITRTDIINDDLGALTAIPKRIGRGAGLELNNVFWTAFLANSNFFKTGNNNYYSGAGSALQSSSLATALAGFRNQKDKDNKILGAQPKILLAGPSNEVALLELMQSTNYNTGGSSTTTKVPNKNIWAGKFDPTISAYLEDTTIPGYSTTAWYLLAEPMDVPTIEVAFLNGVDSPTVETAEEDFDILGIQMRGYFDFGVGQQDYRGGNKSAGA